MRLLFTSLWYCTTILVWAQQGVDFDKEVHDFGNIREEDGFATARFQFVNNNTRPIVLQKVESTCGCTVTEYSKEPILPQDSGFVSARITIFNRPNLFSKNIYSTFDSLDTQIVLTLKGNVIPRRIKIEEELPIKLGNLRFQNKVLNLGNITTEKPIEAIFSIFNDSEDNLAFEIDKMRFPKHIKCQFTPQNLKPKERGKIALTYDPNSKNDLGFLTDTLHFITSDIKNPLITVPVIATVEEYFPPLSEDELLFVPKLEITPYEYDFGYAKVGDTLQTTFELKNSGERDLAIRQIKTNCECTTFSLPKDILKPNETVALEVFFDTQNKKNLQYKNITIFSNAPSNPTQVLLLKAHLK